MLLAAAGAVLVGLAAYSMRSTIAPPSQPVHLAQPNNEELIHLDDRNHASMTSLSSRPASAKHNHGSLMDSYQDLLGGYSHASVTAPSLHDPRRATKVQALARREGPAILQHPLDRRDRAVGNSIRFAGESLVEEGGEAAGSAEEAEDERIDFARSCSGMGIENWMSWATEGQDQDDATCPTQQSSTWCRTISAATYCGLSWRPLMATKQTAARGAGSCAITNEQVWCLIWFPHRRT